MTGDVFRRHRQALGLSQSQLARHFEVTQPTISRWEKLDEVPMLAALAIVGYYHWPKPPPLPRAQPSG